MLFSEPELIALDDKGSELIYYPCWYNEGNSRQYFDRLQAEIKWQQDEIKMYGKTLLLPRLTAWYGNMGVTYAYSGIRMVANGWTPILLELKRRLDQTFDVDFNSVLLNLYRNGADNMGWHSDDESELGEMPFIASLNFGMSRRFDLRHKQTKRLFHIELAAGSLLIMKGHTQRYWQHRVAKTSNDTDKRINLTFRMIETD